MGKNPFEDGRSPESAQMEASAPSKAEAEAEALSPSAEEEELRRRDFDGEGYNEDVDSIADLIDSMHRDFLLTSTTTTMTTMTRKTTEPDMRGSTTIKKYDREFSRELSQTSTRSGGAQSGKWDTSVDQIIPDIFARIYGCKGVPQ